jgi:hypothetical protein
MARVSQSAASGISGSAAKQGRKKHCGTKPVFANHIDISKKYGS